MRLKNAYRKKVMSLVCIVNFYVKDTAMLMTKHVASS